MLKRNFWGATFLIAGGCIGAGMLALPIVMSDLGLRYALYVLAGVWVILCYTGLLTIESTLWFPEETSYISIIRMALGRYGGFIAWAVFALLLYSLLAAYNSVGGQIITSVEHRYLGHDMPNWIGTTLWTAIFAFIIFFGMALSEKVNRLLILGLGASFIALSATIAPNINLRLLHTGNWHGFLLTLPIVTAAFGYHIILPGIRNYLSSKKSLITWAVILGTFLPLCFYALWIFLIFGVVPQTGEQGLLSMIHAVHPVERLTQAIAFYTNSAWIAFFVRFFTFFAITSSLIAVALGLFDLLSDAFQIYKDAIGRLTLVLMTFMPPYFYSLLYPKGFILALSYAGVFVVILHGIMPALIAWIGRYEYWQSGATYKVWGGKPALIFVMCFAVMVIFAQLGVNLRWF